MKLFECLYRYEKERLSNEMPYGLVAEASHSAFSKRYSPVQVESAILLVGAAYCRYGFSIFSPLGRDLLSAQVASTSGLPRKSVESWLERSAYTVLEDLNVVPMISGEPSWEDLDRELAHDILRRILCSNHEENDRIGLNFFGDAFLNELRVASENLVSDLAEGDVFDRKYRFSSAHSSVFADALEQCRHAVSEDFLQLFLWRIECFARCAPRKLSSRILLKDPAGLSEELKLRLACVLTVLSAPVMSTEEGPIFDYPIPSRQILALLNGSRLGSKFERMQIQFDLQVLRDWMQGGESELAMALKLAVDLEFVYQVIPGKGKPAYGLTHLAQCVVEPYAEVLREALLSSPTEMTLAAPEGEVNVEGVEDLAMAAFMSDLQKETNGLQNSSETRNRQSSRKKVTSNH